MHTTRVLLIGGPSNVGKSMLAAALAAQLDGAPVVELGYGFRSDHWNRGLATEAAMAVRRYAFETLQLPRLVSLIRHGNGASRRVAEKIGMRIGCMRWHARMDSSDVVLCAILAADNVHRDAKRCHAEWR